MKLAFPFILSALLSLCFMSSYSHASQPVSTGYWDNIAIGGYDSFDYHQQSVTGNSPTKLGTKTFVITWQGADWRFASQASADKFAADPDKYAPRYNGHCANALSLGEGLISTSGKVWEFFDNKLHLFYAERGRQRWLNGDWKTYQKAADQAWKKELLKDND